MEAVHDHILAIIPPPGERTAGGVHLPHGGKIEYVYAKVLSVGTKVSTVKVGDIIVYDYSAARPVVFRKQTDSSLVAVIEQGVYLRMTQQQAHELGIPIPAGELDDILRATTLVTR